MGSLGLEEVEGESRKQKDDFRIVDFDELEIRENERRENSKTDSERGREEISDDREHIGQKQIVKDLEKGRFARKVMRQNHRKKNVWKAT